MASIVVDDPGSQFTYGGGTWSRVNTTYFIGNSATWPDFARDSNNRDTGVYGSFNFNFQGTAVAFFGNTPPATNSQWVLVSIDGGPAYNTSFMDPSPPSLRQWYQSPTLPDTNHSITVTHIASTYVDYAVVTAGQNTPLTGETILIVDDGDPSITYAGGWTQNTNMFTSSDNLVTVGLPFGNATHQTTSIGASETFRFSGTNVLAAGVFAYNILGTLSVKYTVDGIASIQTYTVTPTTPEYTSGVKQRNKFLLFQKSALPAGDHTLVMQVVDCVNLTFELDFFVYLPSFSSLASKPGTISGSQPSPGQSTSAATPSTSSNSTTTSKLSSSSTSNTATPQLTTSPNKSSRTAAIAGGVAGGVICSILLIFLILCRKKIFSRRSSPPPMETRGIPGPLSLQPFISLPSASRVARADNYNTEIDTASPNSGTQPVTSGAIPRKSAQGEDIRPLSRMNRLEVLLEDLRHELTARVSDSGDNTHVAEVRGHIAELVREESEHPSGGGSAANLMRETENVPPPAYELG